MRSAECQETSSITTAAMDTRTGALRHVESPGYKGCHLLTPAFMRLHPTLPLMYVATETITGPGQIVCLQIVRARSGARCAGGEL